MGKLEKGVCGGVGEGGSEWPGWRGSALVQLRVRSMNGSSQSLCPQRWMTWNIIKTCNKNGRFKQLPLALHVNRGFFFWHTEWLSSNGGKWFHLMDACRAKDTDTSRGETWRIPQRYSPTLTWKEPMEHVDLSRWLPVESTVIVSWLWNTKPNKKQIYKYVDQDTKPLKNRKVVTWHSCHLSWLIFFK